MSINLVTYANQTVTPTNDAIIYEKAVDQNGIFYGCNVTVSGNNVNITGGYGIVCGREFVIESESIPVTLAPSVPLDGRLYVRLDLADADNPIQLLTAQGGTLPALEQDANVNFVNGVWEMELATFTVGVSALSDVVETFETITGVKQKAKDEAKNALKWNEFGTTSTGTAVLDFSSIGDYEELLVEVFIDGGNNREFFHVPVGTLVEGAWLFLRQGGYAGTAATTANVTVGVQKWKAFLSQAYLSGSDKTSTSIVRVWYR